MNGQKCFKEFDVHDLAERDELEAQLQGLLCGKVRDFRFLVFDEGIILQGYAHTYHAKQLAQHAVMQATQIPILANQIEVN